MQKQNLFIKLSQGLYPQFKLFIELLPKNSLELEQFIQNEICSNPFLKDTLNHNNSSSNELHPSIPYIPSVYESYLKQIKIEGFNKEEKQIALSVLNLIDEYFYLPLSLSKLCNLINKPLAQIEKVLKIMQFFEPIGAFTKNLKERVLVNLLAKKKENELVYQIVQNHFEEILKNQYQKAIFSSKLNKSQIIQLLKKELESLPLSINEKKKPLNSSIKPDLIFEIVNDTIKISFSNAFDNLELIPFANKINCNLETKKYLQKAKNLCFALNEQKKLLFRIAQYIAYHEKEFFMQKETIKPLNINKLAAFLDVHPSTITRALQNKTIQSENGVIPMKTFFSYHTFKNNQSICSQTLQKEIKNIIAKESKTSPYPDHLIQKMLEKKGVNCSRRTIAKLRNKMNIPTFHYRRIK